MMQIFISMASAIRTRSRRSGGFEGQNIGDVTSDHDRSSILHSSSPQRSSRRKHERDASEDTDKFNIEAKRARVRLRSSPARHQDNQSNNRVVATAPRNNSGGVVFATEHQPPSTPRKTHSTTHDKPPQPHIPKTSTKSTTANGRRERAPISFSDKQLIAESGIGGTGDGKRHLRSEQGAHYKSELSAYFPEYDEVIGNVSKESQLLTAETQITIVDDNRSKSKSKSAVPSTPSRSLRSPGKSKAVASPVKSIDGRASLVPRGYPDSLFTDLNDTKHYDLGFHLQKSPPPADPLPNSLYEPAHRRLTRAEKSVRNQDKDRAQHEKDRVIQLLDGLKGHDWLKVLGVTGITESKKKDFDGARKYFISGCENIIERFRLWKEEEKRRKLEKSKVIDEEEEVEEEGEEVEDGDISDGDPPDYTDVDASAARQLHDEAVARMTPAIPKSPFGSSKTPASPFKSFFDKPRIREASVRKHRRTTRSEIQAFGHPVPEIEERDFVLNEELIKEGDEIRKERAGRTTRSTRRGGGGGVP